jgi:hypothetical protein
MMNLFFQTRIHHDNIKYTAIDTPQGLHEWTMMPQGGRNAPATHQQQMFHALQGLISKICHAYLDDIIIWLQTVAEQHLELKPTHLKLNKSWTGLFLNQRATYTHFLDWCDI